MPAAIFVPPISTAPITSFGSALNSFPSLPELSLLFRQFTLRLQQTKLVLHNERTIAESVAVRPRKSRQLFRRELRRNNIDQKLPVARHVRNLKHKMPGIFRQILPDQHHVSSEFFEIPRHR